jgi:hypothetical protein
MDAPTTLFISLPHTRRKRERERARGLEPNQTGKQPPQPPESAPRKIDCVQHQRE